jgi:competence protein ComEC
MLNRDFPPRSGKGKTGATVADGSGILWQAFPWWAVVDGVRHSLSPRAAFLTELDGRRLFHWLPVCMGIGIILFFVADGVPSPWPAASITLMLLSLAWRVRQRLVMPVLITGVAFVFLGFAAMAYRTQSVASPVLDRTAFASFTAFVEMVDAGPHGGRMMLRLTSFSSSFSVTKPERVRVTFRGNGPRAGDHIAGKARLMPPPQPAFPGGYDFARDAYFLQLGAVGRWSGPVSLAPQKEALTWSQSIPAAIDNARTDLTNRIAKTIGGQAGALSAALVTGKRGLLNEGVNDELRASGLYHIVSISGLHMVLAAGVFFWLARAILVIVPGLAERRPVKKWAACVAMIGATAYCIFSGSEVATERSLIMTLVLLGAILLDRPALSMRNLAIAALIVLIREPETLVGPSFQMSFAAVAAMIAGHEWWLSRAKQRREPTGWGGIMLRRFAIAAVASVMTTLIASFATAPFAAYHFQRVNPYGLIGNAMAIPFVSFVVMPSAVAGTLLLPFGLDAPIWQMMGAGSQKVLDVAAWVAKLDGSVRGIRAFDISLLIALSSGFLILVLIKAPIRLAGLLIMLVASMAATRTKPPDMLIDRQGQVAALRNASGDLQILGRGVNRFVVERWLSADGDLRRAADISLRQSTTCDRLGCTGTLAIGGNAALVLTHETFEEDCRRATIIITPLQAPAFCRETTEVIDRERLQDVSSLAIRFSNGKAQFTESRPSLQWKPWFGRKKTEAAILPTLQTNAVQQAPLETPTLESPQSETPDDGADILTPQ